VVCGSDAAQRSGAVGSGPDFLMRFSPSKIHSSFFS
jgi:hypothetical protein